LARKKSEQNKALSPELANSPGEEHNGLARKELRMRNYFLNLGAGLLCTMLAYSQPAAAGDSGARTDEAAIRALVAKINGAWRSPNGASLMGQVISEKGFVVALPRPGYPKLAWILTREELLGALAKVDPNKRKHWREIISITVVGPLAYEYGTSFDQIGDGPVRRDETINVYAKDESGWRMVSSVPAGDVRKALGR